MNRGLLAFAVAALALPLAGSAATRQPVSDGPPVELVALLDGRPLAERPHARAEIEREQTAVAARIEAAVPGARIRWRYQLVLNGFAVVAPADAAARIAALPGVREVQQSVRYHRDLYSSPQVIGAPQVWGSTLATAGNGIKIGVIDDGVDQTHPFFSPQRLHDAGRLPEGERGLHDVQGDRRPLVPTARRELALCPAALRPAGVRARDARRRDRRRRPRHERARADGPGSGLGDRAAGVHRQLPRADDPDATSSGSTATRPRSWPGSRPPCATA